MTDVVILASLAVAGCSLAVSVAAGLTDRKRPFSLLRLAGAPLGVLRRVVALESAVPLGAYRELDATLAGIEGRRDNISQAWSWLGSYDIGREYAGRLFGDVQAAAVPKLVEHTPDQLGALVRTMSFYARLSPGQRQALDREHEAIYQRLGRPVRASTIAVLLTARRRCH